jgi:uncharacterized protein (TIGR03067 family)
MKALAFAALAMGAALAGLVRAADDQKSDLERIQGSWLTTGIEVDGQKAVPPATIKTRFKDKNYSQSADGKEVETGAFALDDSKNPKTIDFKIETGPDAGKDQAGIYKFDGEELILCVARPGDKTRPKSFETKDTEAFLVRMKAEK